MRSRSHADPRLLLLDEPHAGLDEQSRGVLADLVRSGPAEGRTVLIASHELDVARELATREVRISAGQMRAGHADRRRDRVRRGPPWRRAV